MSFSHLPWRVGRKVGRTIYDASDKLIGVMDTVEDAGLVVEAVARMSKEDIEEAETIAPSLERFESALAAQEEMRIRDETWNEAVEACAERARALGVFAGVVADIRRLKRDAPK